jgi:hypothetical protein
MVSKSCRKVPQSVVGGNRIADRRCDLTIEGGTLLYKTLQCRQAAEIALRHIRHHRILTKEKSYERI